MPTIYQSDDPSNSITIPALKITRKHIKDAYFAIKEDKPVYESDLKTKKKKKKGSRVSFKKMPSAIVGEEVYIIVETENAEGLEMLLNVRQGSKKGIVELDETITVQQDGKDTGKIKATVGNLSTDSKITNKEDFKDWAIVKIILQPKKKSTLKVWNDALKNLEDKKTRLYILVDADSNNDYFVAYHGTNPEDEGKPEHKKRPKRFLDAKDESFELKKKMPIIVIDSGHGGTKGNTGASYIKGYKHKVKGDKDKPVTEGKPPKTKIIFSEIDSLPSYLNSDIKKEKSGWTWVTKRVYDNTKLERDLVWKISIALEKLLKDNGYPVSKTRDNKIIIGKEDRGLRNKYANNKKADYFISIHADGDYNPKKSGSHTIYREKKGDLEYNKISKEFATDIFSKYTIISKHDSPKKDIRGLQVLSAITNKTKRKVLIELGYITNTSDYNLMLKNTDKIAIEIFEGLTININKYF